MHESSNNEIQQTEEEGKKRGIGMERTKEGHEKRSPMP